MQGYILQLALVIKEMLLYDLNKKENIDIASVTLTSALVIVSGGSA